MRVDVHVHTNKHSGCAVSSPEEMVRAAIAAGLDAIVLTEHDYMWEKDELGRLQKGFPEIMIFSGIEVSLDPAEHMVVIGAPDARPFFPGMKPAALAAAVRACQGAAILAHPFRWAPAVRRDILDACPDAIEIGSNSIRNYMAEPIKALQQRLKLPSLACSDGHHTEQLGLYAIDLWQPAQDAQDLAGMIRRGEYEIWTNPRRIAQENLKLEAKIKVLHRLLAEGHTPDEALWAAGLSRSLSYAVKKGFDLLFP